MLLSLSWSSGPTEFTGADSQDGKGKKKIYKKGNDRGWKDAREFTSPIHTHIDSEQDYSITFLEG